WLLRASVIDSRTRNFGFREKVKRYPVRFLSVAGTQKVNATAFCFSAVDKKIACLLFIFRRKPIFSRDNFSFFGKRQKADGRTFCLTPKDNKLSRYLFGFRCQTKRGRDNFSACAARLISIASSFWLLPKDKKISR